MKNTIAIASILLCIALAGILLYVRRMQGGKDMHPTRQSTAEEALLQQEATSVYRPAAAVTHAIDWVRITPPTITVGSTNPVVITAGISDPAVIRKSVNLIYLPTSGSPEIIGTLNDAGINGDLTANDNVFTIVTTALGNLPVGVANLDVSAAFSGTLLRSQTGTSLRIVTSVATTGWVTLHDSQNLFSIQVPSGWNLSIAEAKTPNEPEVKDVAFDFPDGTNLFTIIVYTASNWTALQNEDGPLPVFLGQDSQYVFAYSEPQEAVSEQAIGQAEIYQTLPQVLATFHAN